MSFDLTINLSFPHSFSISFCSYSNGSSNPPTPTPPNYNYCGSTFADANSKCGVSCYDGTDAPCPVGTHCFADAKSCPLVKPPTKKPHP